MDAFNLQTRSSPPVGLLAIETSCHAKWHRYRLPTFDCWPRPHLHSGKRAEWRKRRRMERETGRFRDLQASSELIALTLSFP